MRFWTVWALAAVLSGLGLARPAAGQSLMVAGDGAHLWVVRAERGETRSFTLLHRARTNSDAFLRRVDSFSGRLFPGGLAAAPGKLWMVFDDMHVQRLQLTWDNEQDAWRFDLSREPELPQGASLYGIAANRDTAWALVRVENAATLRRIDREGGRGGLEAVPTPATGPEAVLPPEFRDPPPSEPADDAPEPAAADDPSTGPTPEADGPVAATRLLRLRKQMYWERVPLPEDWPADARAWVLFNDYEATWPLLVTTLASDRFARVRVYRWQADRWVGRDYDLPTFEGASAPGDAATGTTEATASAGPASAIDLQPVAVPPSLLVGQRLDDAGRATVAITLLSPTSAYALGQLSVDAEAPIRWSLAPWGQTVAMVVKGGGQGPAAAKLRWARMDLRGEPVDEVLPMVERRPRPLEHATDNLLLLAALVIATLIMFVFWRRDPQWNQLELPEALALAEPVRRALAAAIDLTPCVAIAATIFPNVGVRDIFENWPMFSSHPAWRALAPAGTSIGLFVLYSAAAELLTTRTVGKALLSLRVATLNGRRPGPGPILLRNAIKAIELVAPLLLILPLIGPFRQRLGDLVARTVVVAPTDTAAPSNQPDERQDGD